MKQIAIILLLLFSVNQPAFCQKTKFEKDIKELLVLTGSAKMGIQVMDQMIVSFKQMRPDIPAEFWDEFAKEVSENDLIDLIIPVYKKYYAHKEIKKIIAFYKTPVGKKMTATLPALSQDLNLVGQKWGQELGEKIAERISNTIKN